jgi:manganese transport protein
MEGHLNLRIQPWIRRLITRLLAITPCFFTILYFGEESLGELLVLSQVVLSLQLGFAIIPLIHFTSDKKLMNEFAIKPWVKILAWISAVIIVGLNVKLVYEEVYGWILSTNNAWWIYVFVLPLVLGVALLLLYVLIAPLAKKQSQQAALNLPHGEALEIGELESISYSKIGIPVDFSENDRNTIRHALLQGGKSANYYLIHIVETAGARYHGEKVMDFETQSDTENLEKYKANLESLGYSASILIGYGGAVNAIASLSKKNNLDLLVMGAHGHKGISDLIFGTTLNAVRHKVGIPVLIIR